MNLFHRSRDGLITLVASAFLLSTAFLGAGSAHAVAFGTGDTLTLDYDLSSASLGLNPHRFDLELSESIPTLGGSGETYTLIYSVIATSGASATSGPLEIFMGGNPGPMSLEIALAGAGDLVGQVQVAIIAGNGGLDNLDAATLTIFNADSVFVGDQGFSVSESDISSSTSVPNPPSLLLGMLGLIVLSHRHRRIR